MSIRTHPSQWVSAQGQYAGSASRFAAYLIDLVASTVIYWLALQLISFVVEIVTGSPVSWHRSNIVVLILYVVWEFLYFSYQWSLGGRTIGMALVGIKVVKTDGSPVGARQAVIRTLTLPLSFLIFGLGFLGILTNRNRHALHDRLAHTGVVYSWDARAAHLRWLARR